MNHIIIKAIDELLEEGNHSKPYDGNTLAIAHALIAIAEVCTRMREPFIESALLQIAEQLEKMNDLDMAMDYREFERKWKVKEE